MVFVAHLKYKMRFTYRNFKFKIPLNCTDGTTLPQYRIYKKQNTGTKLGERYRLLRASGLLVEQYGDIKKKK
jgi:hypothetical protein